MVAALPFDYPWEVWSNGAGVGPREDALQAAIGAREFIIVTCQTLDMKAVPLPKRF